MPLVPWSDRCALSSNFAGLHFAGLPETNFLVPAESAALAYLGLVRPRLD